jgi:hypothetical protein
LKYSGKTVLPNKPVIPKPRITIEIMNFIYLVLPK